MGRRELLPVIFMEKLLIIFFLLILFSSIMVISSINPIQSIFWLVGVFILSGIILIILEIYYVALFIIIIYVGAITILFLFVIMMIDVNYINTIYSIKNIIPIITLMFSLIILQIWLKIILYPIHYTQIKEWFFKDLDNIKIIGYWFYNDHFYFVLIITILLLIAMIGAVVITLENILITKKQILFKQHSRNNSWI